jgi:tetratricopeptide (TPR) repeat protein
MRSFFLALLLAVSASVWAQNSPKPDKSAAANPPATDASSPSASKTSQPTAPNPVLPRSDSVNANALGDEPGESSSKDTQIDLSPPEDDAREHPRSEEAVRDAEGSPDNGEVNEFHPWDPHKAAKDIEVGDFYFKRKNYIAAESRYREALKYKNNDAMATFRLAVCLEKIARPDEARQEYERYLKILPYGPQAEEANKAIARLTSAAANAKPAK